MSDMGVSHQNRWMLSARVGMFFQNLSRTNCVFPKFCQEQIDQNTSYSALTKPVVTGIISSLSARNICALTLTQASHQWVFIINISSAGFVRKRSREGE